jgi:high affinity Mn2+ porin
MRADSAARECVKEGVVMILMRSPRLLPVALMVIFATSLCAQQAAPAPADEPTAGVNSDDRFAIHGQGTFVEQADDRFNAPYAGPNSLTPDRGAETVDLTLYLGLRLWSGAEAWINPEIDQGFGLNDTLGMAAFPSGAGYKVGRSHPYWRLPRLFMRQEIDVSGPSESVEADENQFAGRQSANRWVFTVGKLAVTDVFDNNDYAHDPRHDFLSWTALDPGTFDYAADAWGYTVGGAAEWYQGAWTVRAGVFDLSDVPNSEVLDHGFHEYQLLGELERRYQAGSRPGKILLTVFDSHGRMALLDDAIARAQASGEDINAALVSVRRFRDRTGISADVQQPVSDELGLFARVGKAGGNVEVYEFTDSDQSISAGLSLKGTRWHRAADTWGLVAMESKISSTRERYLNAGGLGILVGDGQLPHPGPEQVAESYYEYAPTHWGQLTLDYQYVVNPAYNRDRGPVSIVALRAHAQF